MSLDQALDRLAASDVMEPAMSGAFRCAYLRHERLDVDLVRELEPAGLIERHVAAD